MRLRIKLLRDKFVLSEGRKTLHKSFIAQNAAYETVHEIQRRIGLGELHCTHAQIVFKADGMLLMSPTSAGQTPGVFALGQLLVDGLAGALSQLKDGAAVEVITIVPSAMSPGPWHWVYHADGKPFGIESTHTGKDVLLATDGEGGRIIIEVSEGDADLIAAVPDLYATAKALLAKFGGDVPDWLRDEATALQSAINKAEGR